MVSSKKKMLIDVHEHGIPLDDKKRKVKCNYCDKVVSGFYRLKCHLGSLRGDVKPCERVPSHVQDLMLTQLLDNRKQSLTKEVDQLYHPDLPLKRKCTPAKANPKNDQLIMVSISDENQVQEHNTSEQNEVEQSEQSQVEQYQQYHEVEPNHQIVEYVNKVRDSWPVTGCSILIEEWQNDKGRSLVNFLVNCPEGTIYLQSFDLSTCVGSFDRFKKVLEAVFEDVGLNNVVQIILPTTIAKLKPATIDIVEEYKNNMCWSLEASHCIVLMLITIQTKKPFGKIINKANTLAEFIHGHANVLTLFRSYSHGQDLLPQPYKISLLTSLFTLGNVVSHKNNLKNMFASSEWIESIWAYATEAKFVANLLQDEIFWKGSRLLLAATTPLVRLLVPIDGIDKLQVGSIYYSLIQAKEEIKNQLGNKAYYYMPFWKIIDDIWNLYLHKPLNSAGCYLNPTVFYSKNIHLDGEIISGLDSCIDDMVQDPHVQVLIRQQLDDYTQGKGGFTDGSTFQGIKDVSPIEWWYRYGAQYPELQKFAIRVLSQTCDGASRYNLKRSLVEELVSSNPIEQHRLEEQTYVEYNMQLKNSKLKART